MTTPYELKPGPIPLDTLRALGSSDRPIVLDETCRSRITASEKAVAARIEAGDKIYGVNTGFGSLATTAIEEDQLGELQERVVLACATGTGPLLDDSTVRLALLLKINALARGYSGVRLELVENLVKMFNGGIFPAVPSQGSVGASGDLAPLGHLSAPLLGVGKVRVQGKLMEAAAGLERIGLMPMKLGAKEGLSLINGTQFSTALALEGLFATENLFAAGLVAGALTIESALGSHGPFDARLHEVREQRGQIDVAAAFRHIFEGGEHREKCVRVQDPYSLRCQPQVMGACLDHLRFAAEVFRRESGAVTDNPLVFPDSGAVVSGGNFHAEPVAMAADVTALAISEIGALSERRIAFLTDRNMSGLPAFLVREGSVNCGFMVTHCTAAALASENKTLAHPASVDSLPTSANQEDHVSMATFAARRLADMARNSEGIIAIELLAAAQGIDLREAGSLPTRLRQVKEAIRERSPFLEKDRSLTPDIEAMREWIRTDACHRLMPPGLLPSSD
jgi:histidine ammonia-lyase